MTDQEARIHNAFRAFAEEATKHAKVWMDAVRALGGLQSSSEAT